jgi:hypothetical protein
VVHCYATAVLVLQCSCCWGLEASQTCRHCKRTQQVQHAHSIRHGLLSSSQSLGTARLSSWVVELKYMLYTVLDLYCACTFSHR